jgi:tetratricopeptide (TPR) repeat protein
MRARCPKCGASIFVSPDGAAVPAVAKQTLGSSDDLLTDLPAPVASAAGNAPLFSLDELPMASNESLLMPAPKPANLLDSPFGEPSFPAVSSGHLPSAAPMNLPAAPSHLPAPSAGNLPKTPSYLPRASQPKFDDASAPLPAPARAFGEIDPIASDEFGVLPSPRAPSMVQPKIESPPSIADPKPLTSTKSTGPRELEFGDLAAPISTPPRPQTPAAGIAKKPIDEDASFDFVPSVDVAVAPRSSAPGPRTTATKSNPGASFDASDDLPLPPPPDPSVTKRGGAGYGEIELDGGPKSAVSSSADGDEFDQIPVEGESGGSLETDGPARPTGAAATLSNTRGARARERAERKPLHRGVVAAGVFAGVVILGGAALSFTRAGPFGTQWIDEALHGAERKAAALRVIATARTLIAADTYGSTKRALRQLDDQLNRTPKEPELIAYDAFAHYFLLARFGNDVTAAARSRALLDKLTQLPSSTPNVNAVQAARELSQGHAERVRAIRSNDPAIVDLQLMALLEGTDVTAMLEAARTAASTRRSVRTRFLLARALYLSDDRQAALREAESVVADAPQHAGARLLAARILAANPERLDRAVVLSHEVEELGREASSDERVEASVLIGEIELGRDRVTPAKEAFERALAVDPRAPAALIGTAKILFRQHNYSEALARFTAASTSDDADVDAALGVGMCLIALGRQAEALPKLQHLVTAHPNEARAHYWLARAQLATDDKPAAERELREAMRLDDGLLDAYTTLSSMLYAAQRSAEAEQVLDRARGRVADQAAIHRALGEGRYARGDFAGAEVELRQAAQVRTEDVRTRFLLAQTLRRLRRFDDASHELDAVQRLDADYPGLMLERGMVFEDRGDPQTAVATFRTALAQDPENADLLVHLGSALIAAGDPAEADRQLTPVVEHQPNVAEAQFVLGRARFLRGNIVEAVRLLERATELDAMRADFRAYAAEANLLRGQFGRALEHANQACTLDPSYARGFWIRGEIHVRQHQAREAREDAGRALLLDPSFAPAMVTFAEANAEQNHAPEAIELYRRALAIVADRADWRARYGRLLADAGRDGDALSELNRATQLGDNLPTPPVWLSEAHRLGGEVAQRSGNREAARRHYTRFIELVPPGSVGTDDARRALIELGR